MSIFRSPMDPHAALKPLPSKRSHVVSVLDIGSTKVVCMIARLTPREASEILPGRTHKIEIIGIGHQKSRGIKSGVISDLDALEGVIRNAVDTAERQAKLTVDSLIVNVSAGRLQSDIYTASIDLGGQEVDQDDVRKVLVAACQQSLSATTAPFCIRCRPASRSMASGYRRSGLDVRRYAGRRHACADGRTQRVKNIELCVNRAHLSVEGMVATPYAAASQRWSTTNSNSAAPPSTWAAARRRSRSSPKASSFMPMRSALAAIM
jgi:cell division protein FtsA